MPAANANANATALFVLTLSARENAHRRARVRLAWHAQARPDVGAAFFVGNYSCGFQDLFLRCRRGYAGQDAEQQAELLHELRAHDDLVLLPLVDVYRHHVRKLKLALGWILAHTPAQWILKADDDTFHRVALAPLWLARRGNAATPTLVGRIQVGTRLPGPLLEPNKNTELDVEAYGRRKVVPPFPLGSTGYALTRAVAAYVVALNGTELQGEDVSMGLWLDEWTSTPAVRIVDAPTRFMTGDGRACLTHPKALVVGHGAMGLRNAQRCAAAARGDVGSVMDFDSYNAAHAHVHAPHSALARAPHDVLRPEARVHAGPRAAPACPPRARDAQAGRHPLARGASCQAPKGRRVCTHAVLEGRLRRRDYLGGALHSQSRAVAVGGSHACLNASAGGRLLRCWPCSRSVRWCIYTQHRVALADLFLCLSSVVPLLSMQQSVLLCIRRAAAPSTTTTGSTETDCTTATNILSSAPPLAPSAASQYDPGFGEPLQQLAHWSQKAGP